jgi:hypothetical protein
MITEIFAYCSTFCNADRITKAVTGNTEGIGCKVRYKEGLPNI